MSLYSQIQKSFSHLKPSYLGSIRFYFKNACVIYIGTLQNISVHLKDVLAKTWRKLKVLGSPAHLSPEFLHLLGMLSSTSGALGSPSWSQGRRDAFNIAAKQIGNTQEEAFISGHLQVPSRRVIFTQGGEYHNLAQLVKNLPIMQVAPV